MDITRDNLLNLIRTGMKRGDLNMSSLERNAGVPKDTIRDFMRGKTQILRADKLQKVMAILEPSHKVPVTGIVGPKAEIFPVDLKKSANLDEVDCPPGFDPYDVAAIRVQSDAMSPVFHEGWIIYYSARHDAVVPAVQGSWQVPYNKPSTKPAKKHLRKGEGPAHESLAEFFGKPCVIKLKDGRMMLRTLKPTSKPGLYNLISYNAPDMRNVEIEFVSKIMFIKT